MTQLYKYSLAKCKTLCNNNLLSNASKKDLEGIVAEKLIYNYAIEMCQSAAVEELFGHPEEVNICLVILIYLYFN
jgi:serine/threonine-protein kinase ULK/ATG1